MRIALISYYFAESTLPLAKHLSNDNCVLDYYFILNNGDFKNMPGFDFGSSKIKFGLNKLNQKDTPETFNYFGNTQLNLFIIYTPPKFKLLLVQKVFLRYIIRKINKVNYDVINIVGHQKPLITFHKNLICTNKVHTIHEVTDHFNNKKLINPLLNYLFKSKTKIIVHSADSLNKIGHYEDCDISLVFKIPFGLFETYLYYDPVYLISSAVKYYLFYGLIRPYKGVDVLLKAVKILSTKKNDFKIVIAGFGEVPELEELKKNEQCIVINKHLNNQELVGLNKAAKAIICPYKSASQSGIITTSFLFGKPIIATNVGAFSEIIINNVNGILIKPNDPNDLVDAILKLDTKNELYKSLETGVAKFEQNSNFSWSNIARLTKEVYGIK